MPPTESVAAPYLTTILSVIKVVTGEANKTLQVYKVGVIALIAGETPVRKGEDSIDPS